MRIRKARISLICVAALLTLVLTSGCSGRVNELSDSTVAPETVLGGATTPETASDESDSVMETNADENRETDVDSRVSVLLDAIVYAYLSTEFGVDPTTRTSGSENVGAFNANVPAAFCAIFGAADMPGKLPINIPVLEKGSDGAWVYGDKILYEWGFSASK